MRPPSRPPRPPQRPYDATESHWSSSSRRFDPSRDWQYGYEHSRHRNDDDDYYSGRRRYDRTDGAYPARSHSFDLSPPTASRPGRPSSSYVPNSAGQQSHHAPDAPRDTDSESTTLHLPANARQVLLDFVRYQESLPRGTDPRRSPVAPQSSSQPVQELTAPVSGAVTDGVDSMDKVSAAASQTTPKITSARGSGSPTPPPPRPPLPPPPPRPDLMVLVDRNALLARQSPHSPQPVSPAQDNEANRRSSSSSTDSSLSSLTTSTGSSSGSSLSASSKATPSPPQEMPMDDDTATQRPASPSPATAAVVERSSVPHAPPKASLVESALSPDASNPVASTTALDTETSTDSLSFMPMGLDIPTPRPHSPESVPAQDIAEDDSTACPPPPAPLASQSLMPSAIARTVELLCASQIDNARLALRQDQERHRNAIEDLVTQRLEEHGRQVMEEVAWQRDVFRKELRGHIERLRGDSRSQMDTMRTNLEQQLASFSVLCLQDVAEIRQTLLTKTVGDLQDSLQATVDHKINNAEQRFKEGLDAVLAKIDRKLDSLTATVNLLDKTRPADTARLTGDAQAPVMQQVVPTRVDHPSKAALVTASAPICAPSTSKVIDVPPQHQGNSSLPTMTSAPMQLLSDFLALLKGHHDVALRNDTANTVPQAGHTTTSTQPDQTVDQPLHDTRESLSNRVPTESTSIRAASTPTPEPQHRDGPSAQRNVPIDQDTPASRDATSKDCDVAPTMDRRASSQLPQRMITVPEKDTSSLQNHSLPRKPGGSAPAPPAKIPAPSDPAAASPLPLAARLAMTGPKNGRAEISKGLTEAIAEMRRRADDTTKRSREGELDSQQGSSRAESDCSQTSPVQPKKRRLSKSASKAAPQQGGSPAHLPSKPKDNQSTQRSEGGAGSSRFNISSRETSASIPRPEVRTCPEGQTLGEWDEPSKPADGPAPEPLGGEDDHLSFVTRGSHWRPGQPTNPPSHPFGDRMDPRPRYGRAELLSIQVKRSAKGLRYFETYDEDQQYSVASSSRSTSPFAPARDSASPDPLQVSDSGKIVFCPPAAKATAAAAPAAASAARSISIRGSASSDKTVSHGPNDGGGQSPHTGVSQLLGRLSTA